MRKKILQQISSIVNQVILFYSISFFIYVFLFYFISFSFFYLNETIGYVVLDIDKNLSKNALELLRGLKGTRKVRMLY